MQVEFWNLYEYKNCNGIQSSIITGISAIVMMNGYRACEYNYNWDYCPCELYYENWQYNYLDWIYEYPEVITYSVTGTRRRYGEWGNEDGLGELQPGDWWAYYPSCCDGLVFGIFHDYGDDISESFVPELSAQNLCGWYGNESAWVTGSIAQGPIPSTVQIVEPYVFEWTRWDDEIITYDLTKFYTFTFTKA